MTTPLLPRALLAILVTAALFVGTERPARARVYTLAEVIELAKKSNPGLVAGEFQTAQVEAQLSEAHRSWLPSGDVLSLLAPVPEIRCIPPAEPATADHPARVRWEDFPKNYRENNCFRTNISDFAFRFKGIFSRTEVRLTQPLYTFGKISAGISAAHAGIAASRDRVEGLAADLELNVRRAYWGAQLAREILETVKDGMGYLDEAQKIIEKNLSTGTGTSTVVDRHRLRAIRADVDGRVLEAEKLGATAMAGLRALIGPEAPTDIEVDPEPLAAPTIPERPLMQYQEQARLSRPEVKALNHLVNAKNSLADLETRKQYPDLVLLATANLAVASSIDNPQFAFANDPFNTSSFGAALALRIPLDSFVRNARAVKVRMEAEEAFHRRREALGGINFEVERAYAEVTEAQKRSKVMQSGEKTGKAWITTVAQNFSAGLAEAKDFSDALLAFFQFRVRALQAIFDLNVAAASLARAVGGEVVR